MVVVFVFTAGGLFKVHEGVVFISADRYGKPLIIEVQLLLNDFLTIKKVGSALHRRLPPVLLLLLILIRLLVLLLLLRPASSLRRGAWHSGTCRPF